MPEGEQWSFLFPLGDRKASSLPSIRAIVRGPNCRRWSLLAEGVMISSWTCVISQWLEEEAVLPGIEV